MHPPPNGPGVPPQQQPPYPPQQQPHQPAYPPQQQQAYPPQQQAGPEQASPGFQSAAARKREQRAAKKAEGGSGALDLFFDKSIDFALIFVGLYAATSLQRCQDAEKEKQEYVSLLGDFKRELDANVAQEASIEKDLGSIDASTPGENLGPMEKTFSHFFEELKEDEKIVSCLHDEFVAKHEDDGKSHAPEGCHELYKQFDKGHSGHDTGFSFEPAVLTPFYRREVWQLYLADGVKTFRNKELAVSIAEVYANADLVEEQVQDIEETYNDAFMKQVGRTAATDMELAEIVHDEETAGGLSAADMTLLLHVDESIKGEHYGALEAQRSLELKVERMKKTVLIMRGEIEDVKAAIDEELAAQGGDEDEETPSES